MSAYYNEHDPKAAAWLRELIQAEEIPAGDVDERSIVDVQPGDLAGFTQCHFFAGIGGWSYALRLAGWRDDRPVWTGSCPCQPFSSAGSQAGGDDPRHLWPAWFRLIRECRPPVLFGEQVEAAVGHGWLDLVCDDLERENYAVGAVGLPAACVGAPHIRQRLWFVADAQSARSERLDGVESHGEQCGSNGATNRAGGELADADRTGRFLSQCDDEAQRRGAADRQAAPRHDVDGRGAVHQLGYADDPHGAASGAWADLVWLPCRDGKARPTQSGLQPLAARLPGELVPSGDPSESYADASTEARVMRLRGYGNSIVAQVAAEVISSYMDIGM